MKFIKKSPNIDAFKFSKVQIDSYPQWFEEALKNKTIYARGYRNYIILNGYDIEIYEGDWIVNEDGRILIYPPEEFDKIYEKAN